MSKKHRKDRAKELAVRPPPSDYARGLEATRSFFTNAVQWGNNLTEQGRDEYSLDDATAARLYAISVTSWVCANYRAEAEAGIGPIIVQVDEELPVEVDDNPLIWFIENSSAIMYRVSISLLIWGKYYLRKVKNARGIPTRLEWLNPLDVSPIIDYEADRFLGFRVQGRDALVPPQDMITDRTFDPLNDFDGVSAYEVAMRQIVGNRELVRFGQKYFQDGTMLGGMITYEGDLDDDEYKKMAESFKQFKGSQNAFKTFIAGGGLAKMDYKPMQPNPVDLAMPEFKAMLDGDTCRAFGVHPVLVGLGDPKDPLSANNTYLQVENRFILNTCVPRITWVYQSLTRQWLKPDFGAWGDLKIIPDLGKITSAISAMPERSTMAVANVEKIWTVDEARDYTGMAALHYPIQVNPNWAMALYREGGITHEEFRTAVGFKPDPKTTGYIWTVDPRVQQVALPSPPKNLSLPHNVEPMALPSRAGASCFVILSLANNPRLLEVQNALRAQYPAMDWTPAKDFHITLVHAPVAGDLEVIKNILPRSINSFALTAGPVETFAAQNGKQPVILRVAPEQTLVALQSGLAASFVALGLSLSPYSDPAKWQPHITLGYLDAGCPAPKWDRVVTVASDTMVCSVEVGDSFQSVAVTRQRPSDESILPAEILLSPPMRSDPLLTKARLFELDNWQKKVHHKGIDAPFEPKHLPDSLAQYVRSELTGLWNPKAVFGEARRSVRSGAAPQPLGATPEEAQDYWREFDALQVDMGAAFTDYMRAVSGELFNHVVERRQVDIESVLTKGHTALSNAWIGNLKNPGSLLALVLAGMQAGDRSLQKEVAANPHRPRAFDVGVSWDMLSQQALSFARSYSYDLIRGIDQTTRDNIGAAVQRSIDEGFGSDQLRDLISQVLVPPGGDVTDAIRTRAKMIGDTESVRAFAQGSAQRWRDAGVTEATFNTVRDEHVCKVCRGLYGTRARLSNGWPTADGSTSLPPIHSRCRCFMRPVTQ